MAGLAEDLCESLSENPRASAATCSILAGRGIPRCSISASVLRSILWRWRRSGLAVIRQRISAYRDCLKYPPCPPGHHQGLCCSLPLWLLSSPWSLPFSARESASATHDMPMFVAALTSQSPPDMRRQTYHSHKSQAALSRPPRRTQISFYLVSPARSPSSHLAPKDHPH